MAPVVPHRHEHLWTLIQLYTLLERLSWNRAARRASGAGVVHNDEWVPAPEGLETLTGEPRGPYCRDLAAVKAALEAKAKEEATQKA